MSGKLIIIKEEKMKDNKIEFKKSSFCQGCFGCVEVAIGSDEVLVRNSKDQAKQTVGFNHEEWTRFIEGIKSGEFNTP
jgi:Domain of unknown function (DUF397)